MLKYKSIDFDVKNLTEDNLFLNNICFGQMGEDFLVNLIFNNKRDGVYIDVGAHDGVRFSNSFAFSRLNWRGILVEAHPDYYNLCKNARENERTKIYNVACSSEDNSSITFYSNYRGSCSTLNPNLNEFYKSHYRNYYVDNNHNQKVENFTNGKIEVQAKKLDTIIEENLDFFNNQDIDLISIDVDGSEEYVLNGFDINKYKPRVVIFEVSVVRNVIENYMKNTNYYKIYDNSLNAIYCRDIEDAKIFTEKLKENSVVTIYDTGHPLGN